MYSHLAFIKELYHNNGQSIEGSQQGVHSVFFKFQKVPLYSSYLSMQRFLISLCSQDVPMMFIFREADPYPLCSVRLISLMSCESDPCTTLVVLQYPFALEMLSLEVCCLPCEVCCLDYFFSCNQSSYSYLIILGSHSRFLTLICLSLYITICHAGPMCFTLVCLSLYSNPLHLGLWWIYVCKPPRARFQSTVPSTPCIESMPLA